MRLPVGFLFAVLSCCEGSPLSVASETPENGLPSLTTAAPEATSLTTDTPPDATSSVPIASPTPKETDICLQRKFLTAPDCVDLYPGWTNDLLAAVGFQCCWAMPIPVEGNPKVSAWLKFDENGDVAVRCLYSGPCAGES